MEYSKNGELKEVYYYKKVGPNEKEVGNENETTEGPHSSGILVPTFALSKNKAQKFKKPKIQPKVKLVTLYSEYNHIYMLAHYIVC